MQVTAELNTRQLAKIIRSLNSLSTKEAKKIVAKAARTAAKQILLPAARSAAPVDTGNLKRNIKVRAIGRTKTPGAVGVRIGISKKDAHYASFQELGWRVGKRSKQIIEFQKATRMTVVDVVRRAEIYASNVSDNRTIVRGKKFLQNTAKTKGVQAADLAARLIAQGIEDLAKK